MQFLPDSGKKKTKLFLKKGTIPFFFQLYKLSVDKKFD